MTYKIKNKTNKKQVFFFNNGFISFEPLEEKEENRKPNKNFKQDNFEIEVLKKKPEKNTDNINVKQGKLKENGYRSRKLE